MTAFLRACGSWDTGSATSTARSTPSATRSVTSTSGSRSGRCCSAGGRSIGRGSDGPRQGTADYITMLGFSSWYQWFRNHCLTNADLYDDAKAWKDPRDQSCASNVWSSDQLFVKSYLGRVCSSFLNLNCFTWHIQNIKCSIWVFVYQNIFFFVCLVLLNQNGTKFGKGYMDTKNK